MKYESKMVLKTAIGLGIALAVAYFMLPEVRTFILYSAPILVALICPVAMLLMTKTMNGGKKDDGAKPDKTMPTPGSLKADRDEP